MRYVAKPNKASGKLEIHDTMTGKPVAFDPAPVLAEWRARGIRSGHNDAVKTQVRRLNEAAASVYEYRWSYRAERPLVAHRS